MMATISIAACRHTSRNGRFITFERLLEAQELSAYLPWKVEILELYFCLLPLNVPVFKSVRELRVVGRRKGALKQEDWFTALRNMSQLRILILRYAIAASTSPLHLSSSRHVHIPLLSRLKVRENVATTRGLMSNITYPIHKCEATISIDITVGGPLFENLCVILADKYGECAQDVAHITISSLSTHCNVWFFLRDSPLRKPKLCVRLNRPEAVDTLSEQAAPPSYEWPGSKDPLVVLLDAFKELTLIELSEFVKAFEETFEVTAAAPVAVAGPAAAGAAPVEEVEEQTAFDVVLEAAGEKKIQVIKVVRELTALGLGEAKAVVDGAPKAVLEGATKEAADKAKAALEEAGATVTLK